MTYSWSNAILIICVYIAALIPAVLLVTLGGRIPLDQGGFSGWFSELFVCGILAFIIAISLTIVRKQAKDSCSVFPIILSWLQVILFAVPPGALFLFALVLKLIKR